ncbi:oxygenase MpaB family protein [Smaragdicoccus niigatensis]|uniref:oxygenase MpaB family protein n=1 Tax=Smaragdicoccus niigatensis TaxID=359359 RepID=UPI00035DB8FC|nr:oxygenase MpaB family protein [Smaragdicoccus niigatensis]
MTSTEAVNVPESAPLGPSSLTWKYLGDRRVLLFLGRTGTLQNMHPAVGAALQDHSNFFDDPWDRFVRSIPQILGTVYDADTDTSAVRVRDYHKDLKGSDSHGRRYHALNPDVYWWTHATFIELIITVNEYFGTPLSTAEKNQVVREGVTWWRSYGLSDRPVIDNYVDFQRYWNHMLESELESNATTDYAIHAATVNVPAPPGLPGPLWAVLQKPVMMSNVWLLNALMPERGRDILGLTWSANDERLFRATSTVIRHVWPKLPERVRYYARAYEGMQRVARTAG